LLINPDSPDRQVLLPIELVIRSSTGSSRDSIRSH
jgi:hypothetical protein